MVSTLNQHSFTNQPGDVWIGRSIGDDNRYRLDQRLGSGGMGDVFIATDTRLGKSVALKLLKESLAITENTDLRERFERECSICAALKSSHIVQVTDYGVTSEGYPFYVMEYLQGQTLGQLLTVQPRLSVERTCNIMAQVCDGLRLAHEGVVLWSAATGTSERIKVVHRDLKPANIMLIPSALGELVKIIDFGIAKIRSLKNEATCETSMFLGTFHYAAPEQFNLSGNLDKRADIYSLGMILYEMLAGVDPFGFNCRNHRVTNDAWLTAHAHKAPIPLRSQPDCDSISPALEAIVMRCLEKRPDHRFSSVTELGEALQAVNLGVPIALPPLVGSAVVDETWQWAGEEQSSRGVISASPPVSLPNAVARSSNFPLRKWLFIGGGVLVGLAIAITLPQFLSNNSSPGISSGNQSTDRSANQRSDQDQFSLNTHQFSLLKTLAENPETSKPIGSAVLSPDFRTLMSGGEDRDPFNDQFFPVKIWNLERGRSSQHLE
ncbi:MAG: serine/threonine protein kinase [Leptolyngbyaceae cyanobacterium CRU_2_3]|nr:serine/threonine protein kinase [Leptolyngbyaceae cyanobacterium CRU_2_3]